MVRFMNHDYFYTRRGIENLFEELELYMCNQEMPRVSQTCLEKTNYFNSKVKAGSDKE